jgi:hypothetical protein
MPRAIVLDTAVAPDGSGTTAAVDLGNEVLCGITTPASLEGTSLTFLVAPTLAGTYVAMESQDGTAFTFTVESSKYYKLSPNDFAGVQFLKLVVGTNQTGAASLTLHTRVM